MGISPRESEVLAALVEHLTNAEIGAPLFISTRIVECHVASSLRKLQVHDRRAPGAIARNLRWYAGRGRRPLPSRLRRRPAGEGGDLAVLVSPARFVKECW
jgi:DNA-binding CsgD family transcriptional regulator